MVFDKNFDVGVCIHYVCSVAYSVSVVANRFSNTVENCAELFYVEAEEVDLRVVEFLYLVQIVPIRSVYLIYKRIHLIYLLPIVPFTLISERLTLVKLLLMTFQVLQLRIALNLFF